MTDDDEDEYTRKIAELIELRAYFRAHGQDIEMYALDDDDEPSDAPQASPEPTAWWSISGVALLAALRRVAAGDSPDVVYMELLANSTSERP